MFIPQKIADRLKDYIREKEIRFEERIFPITCNATRAMVKKAGLLAGVPKDLTDSLVFLGDGRKDLFAHQTGSARLETNKEARSEDLTQLLKESSKHFDLDQGVLGQYQGYEYTRPMENETGKQALRTLAGHTVAES